MTDRAYHAAAGDPVPPPPGCPVHARWSPLDDDYLEDPYPIATGLRTEHPVFYAASLGYLVVTEMADIEAIFLDHETFASTNVQDPVFPPGPAAHEILSAEDFDPVAVMSNRPEPDHGRIRVFTRQGFSNRRIKTLEPYIRRRSHELVGSGSSSEFVDAFAFPLPGETVFRFIGFPEADDERLKQWCLDRKAFSWGRPTPGEQADIAKKMLAYWRYCRAFTAERRDDRRDDLASELITAHERNPHELSYREVESIIYGLSFAGHEAVTALICNALLCLLPRRDAWAEICHNPSLIPNAIEEILRFNSSQISWRRVTTRDTEVRGIKIPAGTKVFLNFASAHRQPDVFDEHLRYPPAERQPPHRVRQRRPPLPRRKVRQVRDSAGPRNPCRTTALPRARTRPSS